jgi:hypothetical protein
MKLLGVAFLSLFIPTFAAVAVEKRAICTVASAGNAGVDDVCYSYLPLFVLFL